MEPAYVGLRNLDHDAELANALGNMLVAWCAAENSLIAVFATITKTKWEMAQAAHYRIPTFEARTKVLRAMICEWQDDRYDTKALYKAVQKLNVLARRRNHWVHGYWAASPGAVLHEAAEPGRKETVIFDFRAEEGSPDRRKLVTANGIRTHIESVHKRTDDILRLARPS